MIGCSGTFSPEDFVDSLGDKKARDRFVARCEQVWWAGFRQDYEEQKWELHKEQRAQSSSIIFIESENNPADTESQKTASESVSPVSIHESQCSTTERFRKGLQSSGFQTEVSGLFEPEQIQGNDILKVGKFLGNILTHVRNEQKAQDADWELLDGFMRDKLNFLVEAVERIEKNQAEMAKTHERIEKKQEEMTANSDMVKYVNRKLNSVYTKIEDNQKAQDTKFESHPKAQVLIECRSAKITSERHTTVSTKST